jgi:hypothetical protein
MKKLFGVLRIAFVLTVMMMSCNEAPLASDATTTSITEADSSKTEHKNCKIDCAKPCCAVKEVKKCCKSNSAKTCAADSATYAAMKAKCQTECGTDSTICAAHKSECKSKSDSTTVNACKVDCTKPCCSADEKKTCKANCEKECCATK